jgi:hypothetical protein
MFKGPGNLLLRAVHFHGVNYNKFLQNGSPVTHKKLIFKLCAALCSR